MRLTSKGMGSYIIKFYLNVSYLKSTKCGAQKLSQCLHGLLQILFHRGKMNESELGFQNLRSLLFHMQVN